MEKRNFLGIVTVEYTYESVYTALKQGVLANGFFVEGATVQVYDAATDTVTTVTSDDTISTGIYRMIYSRLVGDSEINGYIYLVLE